MAQIVQYQQFNLSDFQTEQGVAKLNQFLSDLVTQVQALSGTTGPVKLDADLDLQGKYNVINPKP